jgi:hypothetical protein
MTFSQELSVSRGERGMICGLGVCVGLLLGVVVAVSLSCFSIGAVCLRDQVGGGWFGMELGDRFVSGVGGV